MAVMFMRLVVAKLVAGPSPPQFMPNCGGPFVGVSADEAVLRLIVGCQTNTSAVLWIHDKTGLILVT